MLLGPGYHPSIFGDSRNPLFGTFDAPSLDQFFDLSAPKFYPKYDNHNWGLRRVPERRYQQTEDEIQYILQVHAPQANKKNFQVELDDNNRLVVREHGVYRGFDRLFRIPEDVDIHSITAEWLDDLLLVKLPKIHHVPSLNLEALRTRNEHEAGRRRALQQEERRQRREEADMYRRQIEEQEEQKRQRRQEAEQHRRRLAEQKRQRREEAEQYRQYEKLQAEYHRKKELQRKYQQQQAEYRRLQQEKHQGYRQHQAKERRQRHQQQRQYWQENKAPGSKRSPERGDLRQPIRNQHQSKLIQNQKAHSDLQELETVRNKHDLAMQHEDRYLPERSAHSDASSPYDHEYYSHDDDSDLIVTEEMHDAQIEPLKKHHDASEGYVDTRGIFRAY